MLCGLVLEVRRLVGQPRRRRVHPLAAILEHLGHGVLGEPVDLQVGVHASRSSAAMATSRRAWPSPIGDDRYSARFGRLRGAHPRALGRCGRAIRVDEVLDQVVDEDRVACVGHVAAAARS